MKGKPAPDERPKAGDPGDGGPDAALARAPRRLGEVLVSPDRRLALACLPMPTLAALLLLAAGAEPPARSPHAKVDLLAEGRAGRWEVHLNPRGDAVDAPASVFAFQPDGTLRVSGKGYGAVTSRDAWRDYHLVVEYRWGDAQWGKAAGRARNSGVLVHARGPQGGRRGSWMASIEAEIIEGAVGDLLLLSGLTADGKPTEPPLPVSLVGEARREGRELYWKEGGERIPLVDKGRVNWSRRDPAWRSVAGFRGREDVEPTHGRWGRLEVVARSDTLEFRVNGVVVNRAVECRPSAGRIQLQSEGSEIHFRRWELHPPGSFGEKWTGD